MLWLCCRCKISSINGHIRDQDGQVDVKTLARHTDLLTTVPEKNIKEAMLVQRLFSS